jgi:hypothetical protein
MLLSVTARVISPVLMTLTRLASCGHEAGLLEHQHVDFSRVERVDVGQRDFSVELQLLPT